MAVRNTWWNWCYEVRMIKNARARALAAHKQKQAEVLDLCWSVFMGLYQDRQIRNDYSKAWRSTFDAMEAEKHGSMQLSSEMENLRLSLGQQSSIIISACVLACVRRR